jgi:hypothetical protein
MDYNPWQPGRPVLIKSISQQGILKQVDGSSYIVSMTTHPDEVATAPVQTVAIGDLEALPLPGEHPLGEDTSGGLDQ